ncbi:PLD nuclease N-terminal domain-containing protein [Demequina sp. NBRC 110057]|uniref:PLD nuclease N-terminal domain-containing protein n=1 Tax=Demequina sp. NBRC 110057 TaxID=1570346 RepID=UPI0009FFB764|nr:PLD nuclease N-terminal domain-containing protein [Demequina sp. NBRC 110057]
MKYLVLAALYVGLTAYAVTDVLNKGQESYAGLSRGAWIAIIVLAPYIGPLIWIGLQMRGGGRTAPPAQRAPDDDPDYLRWLRDQGRRDKR